MLLAALKNWRAGVSKAGRIGVVREGPFTRKAVRGAGTLALTCLLLLLAPASAGAVNNFAAEISTSPPASAEVGDTITGTVRVSNPTGDPVSVNWSSNGSTGLDTVTPTGAPLGESFGFVPNGGFLLKQFSARVTQGPGGTAMLKLAIIGVSQADGTTRTVDLTASIDSLEAVTGSLSYALFPSGDRAFLVRPGDQIHYMLDLTNNSGSPATLSAVELAAPAGTTLVSEDSTGDASTPGAHAIYDMTVLVDSTAAPGSVISQQPSAEYSMTSPPVAARAAPIAPATLTSEVLLVAPVLSGTEPASPADADRPRLLGSTQKTTTIRVFEQAGCAGAPIANVDATQFNASGFSPAVPDGETRTYSARSIFGTAVSPCSADVPYENRDTRPPETLIGKAKISQSKRKATFGFSSDSQGATFECKLDKKPFAPCISPKKYKKLKPGKHKFKVRATDPSGNVDPTPAVKKFKVKR